MEAINTFHEGFGAGILKYVTGCNHYGCRSEKNKQCGAWLSCMKLKQCT